MVTSTVVLFAQLYNGTSRIFGAHPLHFCYCKYINMSTLKGIGRFQFQSHTGGSWYNLPGKTKALVGVQDGCEEWSVKGCWSAKGWNGTRLSGTSTSTALLSQIQDSNANSFCCFLPSLWMWHHQEKWLSSFFFLFFQFGSWRNILNID